MSHLRREHLRHRFAQIAKSHDEFVQMCEQSLAQPNAEQVSRDLKMAHDNTWDAIVAKLEAHIADALATQEEAEEMAVSA